MSRAGFFVSLKYGGRNRDANVVPRSDIIKQADGVGRSLGWSECDEAIATIRLVVKNNVRASGSSGFASSIMRMSRMHVSRSAGVTKKFPSDDRWPSERPAMRSSACSQGAPTRRECKKAHIAAGKGRQLSCHGKGLQLKGNSEILTGAQGDGDANSES